MISVRYNELLKTLRESRKKAGKKGNLRQLDVAMAAKIHGKTLSKLANYPEAEVTLETLEKLVSFFFDQFLVTPPPSIKNKSDKKEILDWVVLNLIEIIPRSLMTTQRAEDEILVRARKSAKVFLRDEIVQELVKRSKS